MVTFGIKVMHILSTLCCHTSSLLFCVFQDVEKSWWKKAAEDADLIVSDSDADSDDDLNCSTKQKSDQKRKIAGKQAELDALLAKPLISIEFSGKYPTQSGKLMLPAKTRDKERKSALKTLKEEGEEARKLLKTNGVNKKKKNKKKVGKKRAKVNAK